MMGESEFEFGNLNYWVRELLSPIAAGDDDRPLIAFFGISDGFRASDVRRIWEDASGAFGW